MKDFINKKTGFTIVELLIVIAVIGVLATITIVSYTGITKRAVVASVISDLDNASRKLKLFYINNDTYPITNDCSSAESLVNICLKSSEGNVFSYFPNNLTSPQMFSLNSTNSNGTSYTIEENTKSVISNGYRKSCYEIQNNGESVGSGIYRIQLSNIVIPVYCDMVTSGGGWTLLVTNPGPYTAWNTTTVLSLNEDEPSVENLYSILGKADSIKSNFSGNLNYRIDAESIGRWGGVWEAPFTNTFIGNTVVNNTTNIEQYDTWTLDITSNDTVALTNIMPWIKNNTQTLSTWGNSGSWWGTLVTGSSGWSPAPYINTEKHAPGIIWYWVK